VEDHKIPAHEIRFIQEAKTEIARKGNETAKLHATTHGEHYPIGELYGFKLLVKTEDSMKEGLFMKQNRFFVEVEGYVKYTHNNGHIANDPKPAVQSFLHALEKIPSLIEKYETDNEKLSQNLPVLQEIAQSTWRREEELKELKTELAALDRKIQLSLKLIDTSDITPIPDRLVIAGVPKYDRENKPQCIKI
jgi:hypothetical protein